MADGILDALKDTADFPHIRLGNARPGNRHADDLGIANRPSVAGTNRMPSQR
jgi:hypothetical protein